MTVARPLQQSVTNYLEETGTTEAVELAEVRARVRGFLEKINFEQGDEVNADDVLYGIEKQVYEAQVEQDKAAVEVAKAEFQNADARYKRALPLVRTNVMTEEELGERAADRATAEARITAAQAALNASQIDLSYTEVKSPISGRVGKTLVKTGNLVDGTEATHLTTVINYDPIYANFNISESVLLEIRKRRGAGNQTSPEKDIKIYLQRAGDEIFPFEGRFDYADLAVDQSTGTFLIRGIFPNPDLQIFPGLFVRIRVPIGVIENALLVPRAAIGFDQQGRYLYVVNSSDEVERRNVQLGPELGELQVVLDQLSPTDRVIVRGVQRAREGAKVAPEEITLPPWTGDGAVVVDDQESSNDTAPRGGNADEATAPIFDNNRVRGNSP